MKEYKKPKPPKPTQVRKTSIVNSHGNLYLQGYSVHKDWLAPRKFVNLYFDEDSFDIHIHPQEKYGHLTINRRQLTYRIYLSGFATSNNLDPEDLIGTYHVVPKDDKGNFRLVYASRLPLRKHLGRTGPRKKFSIVIPESLYKLWLSLKGKQESLNSFVWNRVNKQIQEDSPAEWDLFMNENTPNKEP